MLFMLELLFTIINVLILQYLSMLEIKLELTMRCYFKISYFKTVDEPFKSQYKIVKVIKKVYTIMNSSRCTRTVNCDNERSTKTKNFTYEHDNSPNSLNTKHLAHRSQTNKQTPRNAHVPTLLSSLRLLTGINSLTSI